MLAPTDHEISLDAARRDATEFHAQAVAKSEADIDAAIALGVMRKKDRQLEIIRLHGRRLDALLSLLDRVGVERARDCSTERP